MIQLSKSNRELRKPIKELVNATNGASADLQKAMAAALSTKGKAKGSGKHAKDATLTTLKPGDVVLEHAMDLGVEIETIEEGQPDLTDISKFDAATPLLIKLVASSKAAEEGPIQQARLAFHQLWDSSQERTIKGRAAQRIDTKAVAEVQEALSKVLPKDVLNNSFATDNDAIVKLLTPAMFGIAKSSVHCGMEPDGLASVRFTLQGTRSVVIMPLVHLLRFMRMKSIQESNLVYPRACIFMKAMTLPFLQEYVKTDGAKIFATTISSEHVLYVPSNMIVLERVNAQEDAIGFLARGLVKADKTAAESFAEILKFPATLPGSMPIFQQQLSEKPAASVTV